MFTVKHVDDYGNETLFSASGVRVVRWDEGATDPRDCLPGVVVEGVVGQDFNGVRYPFLPPKEGQTAYNAAVFVMNEKGATVANYRLR